MPRHATGAAIAIGTFVEFDSEQGPQAGIVEQFKADIGNGQRVALVRVAGTMCDAPWSMPVNQLQRARAAT